MKTVIIDDEKNACEILKLLCEKINPVIKCEYALTMDDGIRLINEVNPDVVFLDIHLTTGTGFELLDKLENQDFHLVFTTAFEEYALKAFKYSAFDYLLKPISRNILEATLNRLNKTQKTILPNKNDQFIVQENGQDIIINLKDIIYCKSESNYTWLYLKDNSKYLSSKTLLYFEKTLPDNFLRCHQSFLVNLNQVIGRDRNNNTIILKNNVTLPISRRKITDFYSKFKLE